jgi:hypothetical protein
MKVLLMVFFFLGLGTLSYSQNGNSKDVKNGSLKAEELPEVVIMRAGKDFSSYLPDRNPDVAVTSIQNEFIAYDLGENAEGYDTFLVILENSKGSLVATYNEKGKLMTVVEKYENVQLPPAVIYAVYKQFPGWNIVKDKFLYTQKQGDVQKKQYSIKLKKDNKIQTIMVHPTGEIVNSRLANR